MTKCLNYGIQNYIARLGVPFYFAAAGFFLFRKIDVDCADLSAVKNYILKLLRLLGTWIVLLFAGSTGPLWYMGGLVVAVCFLSFLLYKGVSLQKMLLIAVLLYLVGLLGDPYYGLLQPLRSYKAIDYVIKAYDTIFGTTRNGLFMGFPFLILGGVIQKRQISMKPHVALFCFLLSMVALFCEAFFIKSRGLARDVNMYVFLVPAIFFLLVLALNMSTIQGELCRKLRNVGIIIYFSHMFVYQWILWGWAVVGRLFGVEGSNSLLNYILTVVFATALGFLADGLSKKKALSFLRYLYS